MPLRPEVRRLSLIGSVALGSLVAWKLSGTKPSSGPVEARKVPVAEPPRKEGQATAHSGLPDPHDAAPPAPIEEILCDVPPIEGVPEVQVQLSNELVRDVTGGHIPAGKYRLSSAASDDPEKLGGLWTMLFDFASDGQGAFYRRLGLRKLSSRIRYQASGGRLSFQMVCPDLDKSGLSFFYSTQPAGLKLMTDDGVVIVMERFADSAVEGMAPPREAPEDKRQLPPRQ